MYIFGRRLWMWVLIPNNIDKIDGALYNTHLNSNNTSNRNFSSETVVLSLSHSFRVNDAGQSTNAIITDVSKSDDINIISKQKQKKTTFSIQFSIESIRLDIINTSNSKSRTYLRKENESIQNEDIVRFNRLLSEKASASKQNLSISNNTTNIASKTNVTTSTTSNNNTTKNDDLSGNTTNNEDNNSNINWLTKPILLTLLGAITVWIVIWAMILLHFCGYGFNNKHNYNLKQGIDTDDDDKSEVERVCEKHVPPISKQKLRRLSSSEDCHREKTDKKENNSIQYYSKMDKESTSTQQQIQSTMVTNPPSPITITGQQYDKSNVPSSKNNEFIEYNHILNSILNTNHHDNENCYIIDDDDDDTEDEIIFSFVDESSTSDDNNTINKEMIENELLSNHMIAISNNNNNNNNDIESITTKSQEENDDDLTASVSVSSSTIIALDM